MQYLRIKNWEKWQSYRKDRGQPPWIKVHRCLMRNLDWVSLTDAQRGQLVAIWMLAADHNGVIPASPEIVQKLCYMSEPVDLQLFIEKGFIVDDANVASTWRQDDANVASTWRQHVTPETETETEAEKIREREYNAHAHAHAHARETHHTQEGTCPQKAKTPQNAPQSKNDLDPIPTIPLGENAALNASYASQNENLQPNSFVMKPSERIVSLQGQNTGPSPQPPSYTLEEVLDRATMAGLTDDEATDFFHHYNAQGWVRANGYPVKNLASAMARWKKRQHEFVTGDKKDVRKRISGTGKTAEDYAEAAARDGSEYVEF